MKIEMNGYEVEIKARLKCFNGRYNKHDTMSCINALLLDLQDLADYMKKDSEPTVQACAQYRQRDSDKMFYLLKELGYYN